MPGTKNVNISQHPLIAHKMTLLRSQSTMSGEFRRLLKEITFYLGFEATTTLSTGPRPVTTPMNVEFDGKAVNQSVAIIPILRAGLGMGDALLELLPMASVHHIGMYRSKAALMPVQYYNRLPRDQPCDVAFVTDPCIASANTISAVVSIVKQWGAKKVVVIAAVGSKAGVKALTAKHPDIEVFIGDVDDKLTDTGYIVPGLGDAGDRQFSTPVDVDPDVLPGVPGSPAGGKKRKNSQ